MAFVGGLGGGVVGIILSLLLIHLKMAYGLEFSSMVLKVSAIILICIVSGMIAPKSFMLFFLCPISWIGSSDSSGGGHGGPDVPWPDFLLNTCYMLGLVLFVVGTIFSFKWLAGAGFAGIAIFSLGVLCGAYGGKSCGQGISPNA